jgi:magnesium chelatase subunit D
MDPLSPWDRVTLALTVLGIDPAGIKGLWLRARASAVRDHVTATLPTLPLPLRRLHPNIDDSALFGGIDLTATLSAGRVVTSPGLLDTPAALVLTMAERCPPGLAARLSRTLDDPGFSLIALDEGAEPDETLPPALTDRLGLFLDLTDIAWSESAPIDLTRIATARAALPTIQTPPDAIATLTRVAHALTIDSLRAPLLALACARALAAWNGHATVTDEDLQRATELTLAHRGEVPPTAEDAPPEDTPPPEDPPENPDDPQSQNDTDTIPDDILLAAARAALPADLLAKLAAGRAARAAKGSSGTGAARKGNHRGRPLPSRPGKPGSGKRIDLIGTLRAAAPWQSLRRRGPATETLRIEIRPDDIRLKRYNETSDRLLIFAVDASGSSALARLAEAKGAVELLLAQAYARRDHVALVAFRGTAADLVLPPTRSLVQTKRRLAGLPGGGGTPLAAGLKMAFDLALQSRARGLTPTVALLTDGRGNIALDGTANRAMAEADSLRLARSLRASGIPALVIDIANRPQPALRQLADLLDAPYLALPRADARKLSAALSLALVD